jgi:hypothetical protein
MTKKQLQDVWLKKLKSGRYKQGIGRLHKVRNRQAYFCCLGLACKVYHENVKPLNIIRFDGYVEYDEKYGELPKQVQKAFGFRDSLGKCSYGKHLSEMNDSGNSFKEIAEFVENNRSKVFK